MVVCSEGQIDKPQRSRQKNVQWIKHWMRRKLCKSWEPGRNNINFWRLFDLKSNKHISDDLAFVCYFTILFHFGPQRENGKWIRNAQLSKKREECRKHVNVTPWRMQNDISLNHDWQTMKNCLEYFSHLRSFSLPLKISCLWKLPHTTKCVLNGSQIFVVNMGFTGIKVFIPFFSSNNWYPLLWFALIFY